jgi:two-component SAPR family response regulator
MNHRMILVVDEDEITRDLVERTLSSPYRVLRVREGKRAIELTQQGGIEIAIVSRCLPDIDGLVVVKTLTEKFPSLPVIFVADVPTKDLIISAFRSGARDFIEKPINPVTLLESISRITGVTRKNNDVIRHATKPDIPGDQNLFSFTLPEQYFAGSWFRQLVKRMNHFFVPSQKGDPEGEKWNHKTIKSAFTSPENQISPEEQEEKGKVMETEEIPEHIQYGEKQSEDLTPALSVCCLGKFQVILNGQVIENWTNRKGRELFTYLVMNHKRRTYRDTVMDIFWPNSEPDSARNSMNVAIHCVRSVLHKVNADYEYILFKDECYFLNPEIEIWVDAEEFLNYWKIAQSTERETGIQSAVGEYELAAALYKGDFMEEDLYESWPCSERENFKEIYLFILDRLSEYYWLDGKPSTAAGLCETILEKDNCREDIHRRLMRCYYQQEQRDKALKQYRKCVEALKTELEVTPTGATNELYEQIKKDSISREEKNKSA